MKIRLSPSTWKDHCGWENTSPRDGFWDNYAMFKVLPTIPALLERLRRWMETGE